MSRTLTVITFHFGDIFWVKTLHNRFSTYDDGSVKEIFVVDQSRVSDETLREIFGSNSVISFNQDSEMIEIFGHDHPSSVHKALRSIPIKTSHVLIIDSDCFPRNSNWAIETRGDFVFASDPALRDLTHPCFALFPAKFREIFDFTLGTLKPGEFSLPKVDFGRTLALQTKRLGFSPVVSPAIRNTFGGFRGYSYFNSAIYHHGSASFAHSLDPRLQSYARDKHDLDYKKQIAKNRFFLSPWQRLRIKKQALTSYTMGHSNFEKS